MFSVLQAFWNKDYQVGEGLGPGRPLNIFGTFFVLGAVTQLS